MRSPQKLRKFPHWFREEISFSHSWSNYIFYCCRTCCWPHVLELARQPLLVPFGKLQFSTIYAPQICQEKRNICKGNVRKLSGQSIFQIWQTPFLKSIAVALPIFWFFWSNWRKRKLADLCSMWCFWVPSASWWTIETLSSRINALLK